MNSRAPRVARRACGRQPRPAGSAPSPSAGASQPANASAAIRSISRVIAVADRHQRRRVGPNRLGVKRAHVVDGQRRQRLLAAHRRVAVRMRRRTAAGRTSRSATAPGHVAQLRQPVQPELADALEVGLGQRRPRDHVGEQREPAIREPGQRRSSSRAPRRRRCRCRTARRSAPEPRACRSPCGRRCPRRACRRSAPPDLPCRPDRSADPRCSSSTNVTTGTAAWRTLHTRRPLDRTDLSMAGNVNGRSGARLGEPRRRRSRRSRHDGRRRIWNGQGVAAARDDAERHARGLAQVGVDRPLQRCRRHRLIAGRSRSK